MSDDFTEIIRIPEFEKDLKKLRKKYSTLEEDINQLINSAIKLFHFFRIDNKGIFEITNLNLNPQKFFKVKKFASRSFKGKGANSGLRLIYKYDDELRIIELIEIYYKGDKENMDKERIYKNFKK
jgi:mRNA-degrading endonuclease RelE of RelBE toxin-antitoxin system